MQIQILKITVLECGTLERQVENTWRILRVNFKNDSTMYRCWKMNTTQNNGTGLVRGKNKTIVQTWPWPLINNNNNKIYPEFLRIESIATMLKHTVVQEPMKVTFVRVSNWFSKVSNLESNLSSWANVYTKKKLINVVMIQGCSLLTLMYIWLYRWSSPCDHSNK